MAIELRHTDKIGSVLWLLLAAGIFVVSADFPTGDGETGAAFYPRVIAVLIVVFALMQLARSLYDAEVHSHEIRAGPTKQVAGAALLVVVYVFLLPWLGFITATVAFMGVTMVYSGARSPMPIIGISIGMAVLLYYVFAVFLLIPLPESPFVPIESLLPGVLSGGSFQWVMD